MDAPLVTIKLYAPNKKELVYYLTRLTRDNRLNRINRPDTIENDMGNFWIDIAIKCDCDKTYAYDYDYLPDKDIKCDCGVYIIKYAD